jgi:hypothetical protein
MRGPELDRERERDQFDPVTEGARYQLSPELSLALWERVCTDATDSAGRRDLAQAQQRFHDLAASLAARGGRLRPDVGKLTRVGVESDSGLSRALHTHELATRTPGRQTLAAAEAHRRSALHAAIRTPGRQTLVAAEADRWPPAHETPAATIDDLAPAPDRHELPGATEVARAMAALQAQPAPSSDPQARPATSPELAGGTPPARDLGPRDNVLSAATLARMERAFGRRFDDVEIHADSPEVPAGRQAFTRANHIYLERGAVDLGDHGRHDSPSGRGGHNEHHDHVLAHELAHVVQQSRASEHGAGRPPTRAALEADAHQAALSVLAGRAATVHLFAPPTAALGFSDGAAPHTTPRSTAPAASARAPSSAPAGHTPPSRSSGGTQAPPPTQRTTFDRPATTQRPGVTAAPITTATQRGRGGDGLLLPEAPGALSPAAAGRLQNIHAANQGVAGAITDLPTADHQTDVARDAVVEPQSEQDANAQHGVVAAVDDRPPPSPEIEAACAHIRQVIRDKRPPSEDKLVDAKPREMAQDAGDQMSDGVDQRAGTVRQGYADMQQNPQGTPSRTPVPATLPPDRVATPPVDAGAGAPDPLHHDDVSLDGDVAAQNKQIDDAGMNTEPAKLVKDGPIGDAHGGADDLQHMAKTNPQKVLADQAAAVTHAQSDMHALQAAAEKALAQARAGTVAHIATHTTGVKGSEEQQRAQAGAQMQAIFAQTQKTVDALLQPLSQDAVARWEAGVAQLSTAFETTLADVKRRIDERHHGHHGVFGGLENAWDQGTDKMFGLPDWVTQDYDRAEAAFADGATSLITDISRDVNKVIEDCKKLIQQARKDIEAIVHSLPASLQAWAQGEAAKLGQKLDQLSQHVDQTQHGLNQDLIKRANSAVQQVREQVADLREQAKGLIGKIAHAIAEFAKNPAKAIINGLLSSLGIPPDQFWSLVNQLGNVISAIAKDPVKFGKGLISGAGQGFKQFFEHFPTHLKEILMNWVFDTLGATGVPVPTDFSGPSIMSTVLAIVGIDTPMVTAMLGGEISDPDEAAEAHKELAGVMSGDPKALVALLREEFDPASLLPMIKDAAISFLIQTIITKAAERIAALLVPGGAILTAVEAIFKVLQWVINNAARIFTLIQSLVGAAAQAVAGNISGVASAVEASLVQIIVVVIDFLAGYLGLGGLGGKLKGVLMKLSGKLKAALKKVIGAIAKRAKARAKAKHHDHKHASDKHAPDAHHKDEDDKDPRSHHKDEDDKDPRSHHKDEDDKDPRSHHKDEDDKDPRSHHKDDDKDPRNHHKHEDDKDPRNHHKHDEDPKSRDKDKDKDKEDEDGDMADKKRRVRQAVEEVEQLPRTEKGDGDHVLKQELPKIKQKYRLNSLTARPIDPDRETYAVHASINPSRTGLVSFRGSAEELRAAATAIANLLVGSVALITGNLQRSRERVREEAVKAAKHSMVRITARVLKWGNSSWDPNNRQSNAASWPLRLEAKVGRSKQQVNVGTHYHGMHYFRLTDEEGQVPPAQKPEGTQTIYKDLDEGHYVDDRDGQKVPRYVSRAVTENEAGTFRKKGEGYIKPPGGKADPYHHVTGHRGETDYSSTSSAIRGDVVSSGNKTFNEFGKVLIDLAKVPSADILDMSTLQSIKKYIVDGHLKVLEKIKDEDINELLRDLQREKKKPDFEQIRRIVAALAQKVREGKKQEKESGRKGDGVGKSGQGVLDVIRTDEVLVENQLTQKDGQIVSDLTNPGEEFSKQNAREPGDGSSPRVDRLPKGYREPGEEDRYLKERLEKQEKQDERNTFKPA